MDPKLIALTVIVVVIAIAAAWWLFKRDGIAKVKAEEQRIEDRFNKLK